MKCFLLLKLKLYFRILATKKVSRFAERRAQEKLDKGSSSSTTNETAEPAIADTDVYRPIIGEIREKRSTDSGPKNTVRHTTETDLGFPKPERLNRTKVYAHYSFKK